MRQNEKLFSEKMSSELKSKIMTAAEVHLEHNKSLQPKWFHRWGLNIGLATATLALALYIYTGQSNQTINADLATTIDLLETVESVEEFEMLAELELIEDLEVIESFEIPSES